MKVSLFIGGLLVLGLVPWSANQRGSESPEATAQALFLRSYARVAKPEAVPAREAIQCAYEAVDPFSPEYDLNLQGTSLCGVETSCGTRFDKVIYHGEGSYVYWTADSFELLLAEICGDDLRLENPFSFEHRADKNLLDSQSHNKLQKFNYETQYVLNSNAHTYN